MADPIGPVQVVRLDGDRRVIAMAAMPIATPVARLEGELTRRPTRSSVQVGEQLHLDLGSGLTTDEVSVRRPSAFLTHSCEPSTRVDGLDVITLHPIAAGDVLTFDFNSTEFEIAEPFSCRCGAPHCIGEVRGFRYLPEAARERLRPLLAPHLLRLWSPEAPEHAHVDIVTGT